MFSFFLMRKSFLLLFSLAIAFTANANPRTPDAMLQAAQKQLSGMYSKLGRRAPAMKPELLRSDPSFRIYGYKQGAFVIVSTDDLMPEVLGYSDADATLSNVTNPNFEWWLDAIKQATAEAKRIGTPLTVTRPDTTKYKADVPALVKSKWGQDEPYNNLCPMGEYSGTFVSGSGTARSVTGCIATAMAQILYYHKAPAHGVGSHSVGVPYDYPTDIYTVNFGDATYDYADMLDTYTAGNYTDAQANAVATLMYHCGIASDMQYSPSGSGTYSKSAADGLKRNFGLSEDVSDIYREDYTEPEWMNIAYNEINNGRPILYTGVSGSGFLQSGHAFVLDGYDNTGKVHINWGWDGIDNGMFDIATLQVNNYSFSNGQGMIIGISPNSNILRHDTLTLAEAGQLATQIPEAIRDSIGELKVIGNINSSDLKVLRNMVGIDESGNSTNGKLNTLDLSNAHFVSGGEPYLIADGKEYTTSTNTLPEKAFYGARRLSVLILPKDIKHIGDGALAASSLREIVLQPSADADYIIKDDAIYSKTDTTDLIALMPYKTGYFTVPLGTKTIHPYAFANNRVLSGIRLTTSVEHIGSYAISNLTNIGELRVYAKQPPTCDDNAIANLDFITCKLYIPKGTKTTFRNNPQFGKFFTRNYDSMIEFGTIIKARNAFKVYGASLPTFGWKLDGDNVHGDPKITTDVDEKTPVGRYPLHISRGTIVEEEGIEYQDGYIIVAPDTLTATVGNYTRNTGEQNPEFAVAISGFDNNEDESVLDTKPVASTTADENSPAGEYAIVVSGGKAKNYVFNYVAGVLTVTDATSGISNPRTFEATEPFDIYSFSGQLVQRNATTTEGLAKGVYIVKNKKYIVK